MKIIYILPYYHLEPEYRICWKLNKGLIFHFMKSISVKKLFIWYFALKRTSIIRSTCFMKRRSWYSWNHLLMIGFCYRCIVRGNVKIVIGGTSLHIHHAYTPREYPRAKYNIYTTKSSVLNQRFNFAYHQHSVCLLCLVLALTLRWRHNERDGVSTHQPHDCWLNRLFKAQIKESVKAPRHCPLWGEFTRWPMNSPHKGPITRKMFPFDDVIMNDFYTGWLMELILGSKK